MFYVCTGYHDYYTDQAMIHLDNNRLQTESKEDNWKRRKETDRVVQQNEDNNMMIKQFLVLIRKKM